MAKSPAHKFGQIIGDIVESAVEPLLRNFAQKHRLYLDKKGSRKARKGTKVSWRDIYENIHDLDFVLEARGSDTVTGTPVAFIEVAWRRYTKHSRNKAQEIQGAILPLLETHKQVAPFIGTILAGVFTDGALNQLRSLGFNVLYFPYESVLAAFEKVGIDAGFDEQTPDVQFAAKVRAWGKHSEKNRLIVSKDLLHQNASAVEQFMHGLESSVNRRITRVRVLPLHGKPTEWGSVKEATDFLLGYAESHGHEALVKYEIQITYSNGDRVEGQFAAREDAIRFLTGY